MMPVCRVLGESPGCTCCSHRLPPRDSPSLGPSQDLGTHSAQQVVGASSRSPVTMATRLWKGGEKPSPPHPSQLYPDGLCQNLPVRQEARAFQLDTQAVRVYLEAQWRPSGAVWGPRGPTGQGWLIPCLPQPQTDGSVQSHRGGEGREAPREPSLPGLASPEYFCSFPARLSQPRRLPRPTPPDIQTWPHGVRHGLHLCLLLS